MKEFLKTVRWKFIAKAESWCFLFLVVSYIMGNSKFPHHIWAIPVIMVVILFMLLMEGYTRFTKRKKDE